MLVFISARHRPYGQAFFFPFFSHTSESHTVGKSVHSLERAAHLLGNS